MANTYTQIHIQVVFAIQDRASLIGSTWKDELYKYLVGIIQSHGHKVLQINGMPDHVHILLGLRPNQALSELMKQMKQDSSKWVNKQGYVQGKFSWQAGFGAFSYSKSEVPAVIRYIHEQEKHHKVVKFKDEYLKMLTEFKVDFEERYLFKPID